MMIVKKNLLPFTLYWNGFGMVKYALYKQIITFLAFPQLLYINFTVIFQRFTTLEKRFLCNLQITKVVKQRQNVFQDVMLEYDIPLLIKSISKQKILTPMKKYCPRARIPGMLAKCDQVSGKCLRRVKKTTWRHAYGMGFHCGKINAKVLF